MSSPLNPYTRLTIIASSRILTVMPYMVWEFSKYFFIGLIGAAIWVVPLIELLYKLKFVFQQENVGSWNAIFRKIAKTKVGTPSLGGILIWLTVTAVWLFINTPFARAAAVVFFLIGLYGFVEESFTQFFVKRSKELRLWYEKFSTRMGKLAVMMLLYAFVVRIIIGFLGVTHTYLFGIKIPLVAGSLLGSAVLFVGLLIAVFISSYSTEIIDGVDGLAAGLYIITLLGYTLLAFAYPASFKIGGGHFMTAMIGALIGALVVYLYFNIPPARVFMGSPGALPMGAIFLIFSLYTDTMEAFIFFIAIYVVDFLTSALQILSMKLRGKRIFPIAPIHHYFQHKGWPDAKVTMRAWLLQFVMVMLGVLVQIWVNTYLR